MLYLPYSTEVVPILKFDVKFYIMNSEPTYNQTLNFKSIKPRTNFRTPTNGNEVPRAYDRFNTKKIRHIKLLGKTGHDSIPAMLGFAMALVHMEVTLKESIKAGYAQTDAQNHRSSIHHLLTRHLSTSGAKNLQLYL